MNSCALSKHIYIHKLIVIFMLWELGFAPPSFPHSHNFRNHSKAHVFRRLFTVVNPLTYLETIEHEPV